MPRGSTGSVSAAYVTWSYKVVIRARGVVAYDDFCGADLDTTVGRSFGLAGGGWLSRAGFLRQNQLETKHPATKSSPAATLRAIHNTQPVDRAGDSGCVRTVNSSKRTSRRPSDLPRSTTRRTAQVFGAEVDVIDFPKRRLVAFGNEVVQLRAAAHEA